MQQSRSKFKVASSRLEGGLLTLNLQLGTLNSSLTLRVEPAVGRAVPVEEALAAVEGLAYHVAHNARGVLAEGRYPCVPARLRAQVCARGIPEHVGLRGFGVAPALLLEAVYDDEQRVGRGDARALGERVKFLHALMRVELARVRSPNLLRV